MGFKVTQIQTDTNLAGRLKCFVLCVVFPFELTWSDYCVEPAYLYQHCSHPKVQGVSVYSAYLPTYLPTYCSIAPSKRLLGCLLPSGPLCSVYLVFCVQRTLALTKLPVHHARMLSVLVHPCAAQMLSVYIIYSPCVCLPDHQTLFVKYAVRV